MHHIIRLIFIISLAPIIASATAQQPDEIIISDKSHPLQTNPLDDYLEINGWKPPEEANIWSSNWRGYIATWRIDGNHLILDDVTIRIDGPDSDNSFNEVEKSILDSLFPNQVKILAKWYTGALIVPTGESVEYVHMGYGSTYSKYSVLEVKKGIIVKSTNFTIEEFERYKISKFEKFKKTETFKAGLLELTTGENSWSEDSAVSFMYDFFAEKYLSQ
ncbi:hypothetical protein [Shewanella maritima]|uniref:hypothetical protein n=1 Tax=Shewanella maritima TaxID=2520507 RepID=UPI00373522E0